MAEWNEWVEVVRIASIGARTCGIEGKRVELTPDMVDFLLSYYDQFHQNTG